MNVRHPFDQTPEPVVLGIEYNEDCRVFAAATTEGFRIFDSATGKLMYEREFEGSIGFASTLSKSEYVAVIGGGPSPHYPPNKFILWDAKAHRELFKIEYSYKPLRACLTPQHYVVVFDRGVMLYKLDSDSRNNTASSRIAVYETSPNPHGLCCLGTRKLAFPGRTKGQVQIVDLETRKVNITPAHNSPLRALTLSKDEDVVATASETGTLIRLWSTAKETRITEVRRGLDHATIFSLSFSPSGQYLAVTSDKSTLHIFDLWMQDTVSPPSTANKPAHTRQKSHSRAVNVPSQRERTASISGSRNSPNSRTYGISPPQNKYRLGTSPTDRTSLTPSDISSQAGGHASPGWNDMLRQQPQPGMRYPSSHPSSTISGSPGTTTDGDLIGYKPTQKWGPLANLPFAPKVLSDTYSDMKCAFDMGNEVSISSAQQRADYYEFEEALGGPPSSRNGKDEPRETVWWPGGRPSKGKIAWIDDEKLVLIGAGRDARWELFSFVHYVNGARGVEKQGWKRYLEDEGLD